MKYSICNEIFEGWPMERIFATAHRYGYSGIEIAPFTLGKLISDVSIAERERLKNLAAEHGMEIAALHWLLAKTEGFHATHPDATVRKRTSVYLRELAKACRDMGGKILVFGSPKQRNLLPGVTQEQATEFARETLRDPIRTCEDLGITLCLEPLGPQETDFWNTAAETRAFAESMKSPACRILLDVKAMSTESVPITALINTHECFFRHFHVNDPNLKGPGFGEVDFKPIMEALNSVNYGGWISVEVFDFSEGTDVIASQSIRNLKEAASTGRGPGPSQSPGATSR